MRPRVSLTAVVTLVLLLGSAIALQALRDRGPLPTPPVDMDRGMQVVQSADVVKRAVLSYDVLAADVYWMRVVQQFGRTKLSNDPHKRYDFLYPLLDLTTSLDPDFEVAYRFGAIFLAEEFPGGAGRPDLALALLRKGLKSHPTKWQYAQDIAFVHYWYRHDYALAADSFKQAARLPLAPNWLAPMAAVTLTQGGNRDSARQLWTQVFNNTEAEWLMDQARFRLAQLDAMDQIDALERLVKAYQVQTGERPRAWSDLVRTGFLQGVPVDPRNAAYELNPSLGTIGLSPKSPLAPLPAAETVRR